MKYKHRFIRIIVLFCLLFIYDYAYTATRSIYIRTFNIGRGLSKSDPIGDRIKDYISEVIVAKGGYTITSDDEVRQVMAQEEGLMSMQTCYDDTCVKKLMQSLRTDLIIYGVVSLEDGRYHVTAKMLDRRTGTVKLTRVKSLEFKDKNKLKMASIDLANYLTEGKKIDMARYDDAYQAVIDAYEKKNPTGLSAYFLYFKPSKAPFKTYYDSLMGGGLEYYFKFNDYLSFGPGIYYVTGDDTSGNVTVSLNSYSLSCRAGYSLLGFIYPYIGITGRVTWYNERGYDKSASYTGYGGDAFAGCSFIVWRTLTIWADYSLSLVKLNDEGSTDISVSAIRAGVMYGF